MSQSTNPPIYQFPGFTLPDGAWLPPEILELLPSIKNLSELKVIIAALYESLRIGGAEAVISLSDFEALTGLDRKSVSRGIDAALKRGSLKRKPVGGTYIYQLAIQTGGAMPLPPGGAMPPNRGAMPPNRGAMPPIGGAMPPHVVCMHDTDSFNNKNIQTTGGVMPLPSPEPDGDDRQKQILLHEIRALGVALKIAQKLIVKFDADYLTEKLRQTRYAVEQGLAQRGPGWFITSVNENWQPPLGYDPNAHLTDEQRRQRYIGGKFADLIKS